MKRKINASNGLTKEHMQWIASLVSKSKGKPDVILLSTGQTRNWMWDFIMGPIFEAEAQNDEFIEEFTNENDHKTH
jgi:hypothetical protein